MIDRGEYAYGELGCIYELADGLGVAAALRLDDASRLHQRPMHLGRLAGVGGSPGRC